MAGIRPGRSSTRPCRTARPVLYHTSLHVCVLNHGRAAGGRGFAEDQPDPPGGAFGRDSEGRLDGVVYEAPMFALFEQNIRRDMALAGAAGAKLVETAGEAPGLRSA